VTERNSRTADGTAENHAAQNAPPGFVHIALGKGQCHLLLTEAEYLRGLRRGKWWRRRAALRRRTEDGQ
jgi:hypothetical protein